MKNITLKQKQGGFTLLELLVVVAILAIIAGAVISAISGQEETAGQGVALHTMGALENATRQHVVIANSLPSGLDSLLCADLSGAISDNGDVVTAGGLELMGASSGTLPNGDFAGGLAPGLIGDGTDGKLVNVTLPGGADSAVEALEEAGMGTLRYAEATACDDTEANVTTINNVAVAAAGDDDELGEVLGQTRFWNASATEEGFGLEVAIDEDDGLPVAILRDPSEIGQATTDVVAVFGVGNFNSFRDFNIISRGPVDGNVDGVGQYYSHFSLAIKVGENADDPSTGDLTNMVPVEPEIVAVLDSDGDNFDDEVAEFYGLEDE